MELCFGYFLGVPMRFKIPGNLVVWTCLLRPQTFYWVGLGGFNRLKTYRK